MNDWTPELEARARLVIAGDPEKRLGEKNTLLAAALAEIDSLRRYINALPVTPCGHDIINWNPRFHDDDDDCLTCYAESK